MSLTSLSILLQNNIHIFVQLVKVAVEVFVRDQFEACNYEIFSNNAKICYKEDKVLPTPSI
jgi:hypothetical protein